MEEIFAPLNQACRRRGERGTTENMLLLKRDLEECLGQQKHAANWEKIRSMIARAESNHYDDFCSSEVAPIMCLVSDAEDARLFEIAQEACNGKYDGKL